MRIASQSEIEAAASAVRTLRSVVSCVDRRAVAAAAKRQVETLNAHVRSASLVIDGVRGNSFNPSVRQVVEEYSRLEAMAAQIANELSAVASYRGPVRSQMSSKEKSQYISEKGQAEYERLPW